MRLALVHCSVRSIAPRRSCRSARAERLIPHPDLTLSDAPFRLTVSDLSSRLKTQIFLIYATYNCFLLFTVVFFFVAVIKDLI